MNCKYYWYNPTLDEHMCYYDEEVPLVCPFGYIETHNTYDEGSYARCKYYIGTNKWVVLFDEGDENNYDDAHVIAGPVTADKITALAEQFTNCAAIPYKPPVATSALILAKLLTALEEVGGEVVDLSDKLKDEEGNPVSASVFYAYANTGVTTLSSFLAKVTPTLSKSICEIEDEPLPEESHYKVKSSVKLYLVNSQGALIKPSPEIPIDSIIYPSGEEMVDAWNSRSYYVKYGDHLEFKGFLVDAKLTHNPPEPVNIIPYTLHRIDKEREIVAVFVGRPYTINIQVEYIPHPIITPLNVTVATTTKTILATDLEAGKSVDGVVLVSGMRVLVKDQTFRSDNGIYVIQPSGSPIRSEDFDEEIEICGTYISVLSGNTHTHKIFRCTNTLCTVGSVPITFEETSLPVYDTTTPPTILETLVVAPSGGGTSTVSVFPYSKTLTSLDSAKYEVKNALGRWVKTTVNGTVTASSTVTFTPPVTPQVHTITFTFYQ